MIKHNFIDYVSQAPGLVLIKDKTSVVQACSPQWAQLIGYDSPEAVQGITDFEIRCDAVRGAEAFIDQDKDTLMRGENRSINVYTYANDNKMVMYGQKTPLVVDDEVVGVNCFSQDLTQLSSLASKFVLLLEKDGRFLAVDAKKASTYIFHDTYPDDFLTKKESMCLFYILRGKSNKEISCILNLSCRTVEGKIISIKKKMGCDSRNQLIEHALHKGYLDIIIKELLFCDDISLTLD